LGTLEAVAAEQAHVGLEGDGFFVIRGDLSGGEEPVEFVFGEWAGEPAE
jgi:hypothetical protein